MVELSDKDFVPLEQFHLKWRWTDPQWNQLHQTALSRIRPLSEQGAHKLWKQALELCNLSGLNRGTFPEVKKIDTSQDEQGVREWLRQEVSADLQQVFISWDQQTAVVTDWEVFCENWDDFCYASSDDVTIWPTSEEWVLCYYHTGKFCLGRRHV